MKRSNLLKLPMRKILAGVVGAACGFTALSASATIVNSAHDLRSRLGLPGGGEICIVCHTPHDANGNTDPLTGTPVSNAPLWNRSLSTATYSMYANQTGTIDGTESSAPDGASRLCLGCHDGTVAYDQYNGFNGTTTGLLMTEQTGFFVGTDLRGQHPISLTYRNDLDPGLNDPTVAGAVTIGGMDLGGGNSAPTRTGTLADLMLPNGKVQCSSCHDVHNVFVGSTRFLRIDNSGSNLCLTCHNK